MHQRPRVHRRQAHASTWTSSSYSRKIEQCPFAVMATFRQHREPPQSRLVLSAGERYTAVRFLSCFHLGADELPTLSLQVHAQGQSWSCAARGLHYLRISKGVRMVCSGHERARWLEASNPRQVERVCSRVGFSTGELHTVVSAAPLQLGRAFHCHLAAVPTSVWYG